MPIYCVVSGCPSKQHKERNYRDKISFHRLVSIDKNILIAVCRKLLLKRYSGTLNSGIMGIVLISLVLFWTQTMKFKSPAPFRLAFIKYLNYE